MRNAILFLTAVAVGAVPAAAQEGPIHQNSAVDGPGTRALKTATWVWGATDSTRGSYSDTVARRNRSEARFRRRHGGHGAVSRALIDPTFTHHAILEDELRINFFRFNRRASDARSVATLELAYVFSDALGVEIFVPYVVDAIDGVTGGGKRLLDLEVQAIKWSFVRRYNLVMTAVGAVVVPIERDGDGEHVWRFEPHLFVDAAVGPVAVQSNFIASFADNGEREIELATSIARMIFFESTKSAGPVLELLWEIPVAGEEGAQSEPFLAPGLKLQIGGWYFGGSYMFPLRSGSTEPTQFALTAGYHVSFIKP